jgi:hypothetical protein
MPITALLSTLASKPSSFFISGVSDRRAALRFFRSCLHIFNVQNETAEDHLEISKAATDSIGPAGNGRRQD